MYSFSSTVRYSECDARSNLTIPALINYLQDCSTFHTESIGHGVAYLAQNHFAWFITAWQIKIDRMPRYCEPIVVSTWCHDMRATNVHRNFDVRTPEGDLLVRADSLWVAYDTLHMRPIRVPAGEEVYLTDDAPVDLPPLKRKIRLVGEGEPHPPVTVAEYHLDTNHHVNNGQYVAMADHVVRSVDEGFELGLLEVQYKRAAQLGDVVVPHLYVEEDGYAVDLSATEGDSFAIVRLHHR